MSMRYSWLWAKTPDKDADKDSSSWHPLMLHLLDVAVCAEAIHQRESEESRRLIADIIGLPLGKGLLPKNRLRISSSLNTKVLHVFPRLAA